MRESTKPNKRLICRLILRKDGVCFNIGRRSIKMTILFGRKRAVKSCAAKESQWKSRLLRLEALENRELLAVDPAFVGPFMAKANSEIVVNSLEDNMIDDEFTTLREAINRAVAGDTITFDASLQGGTITLTQGEIAINKTLTIDGGSVITLDGGHTDTTTGSRIFNITGGASDAPVLLKGLTLQNGYMSQKGGAIYQDGGYLSVEGCDFLNNQVGAGGGALYLGGVATVVNSTFRKNKALSGGGGVFELAPYQSATFKNVLFVDNTASSDGSVAYTYGLLSIYNSTIYGNNANRGAIYRSNWNISYDSSKTYLYNTIIWSNEGGATATSTNPPIYGYNVLSSNVSW